MLVSGYQDEDKKSVKTCSVRTARERFPTKGRLAARRRHQKADAPRGVSNFVIRYVVPFQVALGRINRFANGG